MKDIWGLDCTKFRDMTDRYFTSPRGWELTDKDLLESTVVRGLIDLGILNPLVYYADGNEKTLLLATKLSIDSD
jgi:hypothetical protein